VKLLRSSLPSTVELRTELDEETPPVLLDPVQLEQVLMNLAINARDAMQSSGRVLLTARTRVVPRCVCASCRCNVEGERVELSVEDSGPGIPPDVQERMFEPFFTTKPVGQGSGMGLATVHGIVHEHGGHIVVDSAPGVGTTFRVLLPALAAAVDLASPMQATDDGAPATRSLAGRVAVIDDELPVACFMEDRLAHWGLSVATFTTAHEALDALVAGDGFDLVITDQTMPAMTGIEFARAARTLRPDLPIVLYTGYADGISDADVERAGITAILRKPIEAAELFTVLSANLPITTPSGG
jgi:CheY-like chemotaxis protein